MCFLTLTSAIIFFLRFEAQEPYNEDAKEQEEKIPEDEMPSFIHSAIWCTAVSLSVMLLSMTIIALLDKPLDPPGTLRVNSRYARLSGRAVYTVIILLVPIKKDINAYLFLGIAGVMMVCLVYWEFISSLERGGGVFEPKGLTAMVSSARRAHREESNKT